MTMSTHPNVATIDRMTAAIVEGDRDTLTTLFSDDLVLHVSGPLPSLGDHAVLTACSAPSADFRTHRWPSRSAAAFLPCRRHLRRRVGTRGVHAKRSLRRSQERLHLPLRPRPDRGDVDDLRRETRTHLVLELTPPSSSTSSPGRLGVTASRSTILGFVRSAILYGQLSRALTVAVFFSAR